MGKTAGGSDEGLRGDLKGWTGLVGGNHLLKMKALPWGRSRCIRAVGAGMSTLCIGRIQVGNEQALWTLSACFTSDTSDTTTSSYSA